MRQPSRQPAVLQNSVCIDRVAADLFARRKSQTTRPRGQPEAQSPPGQVVPEPVLTEQRAAPATTFLQPAQPALQEHAPALAARCADLSARPGQAPGLRPQS